MKQLLSDCHKYYIDGSLQSDCDNLKCVAPAKCMQFNAVYNVLHFLADNGFNVSVSQCTVHVQQMSDKIIFIVIDIVNVFVLLFQETNNLTSAMLFLPMAKTTKILSYFYDMQPIIIPQKNDLVAIVAIDMGLKSALFDELLFYDSWLIGLGAMCILYCILIYTNSILITLSTVVANTLSVGMAYFIYQVVLQLPYFPFMNLLAIIIIVGKTGQSISSCL